MRSMEREILMTAAETPPNTTPSPAWLVVDERKREGNWYRKSSTRKGGSIMIHPLTASESRGREIRAGRWRDPTFEENASASRKKRRSNLLRSKRHEKEKGQQHQERQDSEERAAMQHHDSLNSLTGRLAARPKLPKKVRVLKV